MQLFNALRGKRSWILREPFRFRTSTSHRRTRFVVAILLLVLSIGALDTSLCAPSGTLINSTTKSNSLSPAAVQDYRRFALVHQGELSLGKQFFNDERKLACAKC